MQDKFQEYKLIEEKMNFLVQKRDALINQSRTNFEEVRTRLQNLERDDCTNFSKFKNNVELVSGNYNFFTYVLCFKLLYDMFFNNLLIFL